ncbi:MAG: hypothetical protein ACXVCY_18795 [Pseudobdellovibrionaceae bacterium]
MRLRIQLVGSFAAVFAAWVLSGIHSYTGSLIYADGLWFVLPRTLLHGPVLAQQGTFHMHTHWDFFLE